MSVESFLSATRRLFHNDDTNVSATVVAAPESAVPVEQKFRADSRLHRARRNKPGIYKLYLEGGGKILFKVWAVPYHEDGSLIVRIFPISFYSPQGELMKKTVRTEGNVCAFFSRSILVGKWDPDRVPEVCRKELEFWAPLFCDGVVLYEERSLQYRRSVDV